MSESCMWLRIRHLRSLLPMPEAWFEILIWSGSYYTMVRCIMRAFMNDEFSWKFEEAQPEKMLQVLRNSFGTPNNVKRHKTSCIIFNIQMREGASVIDHVLYMIQQIEKLSKLDFSLHKQLEKDVILNFLSKSYLPFLSHFRMMKLVVNYHGLLGLL